MVISPSPLFLVFFVSLWLLWLFITVGLLYAFGERQAQSAESPSTDQPQFGD